MRVQPGSVRRYKTIDGKVPFDEWFESLKSEKTKTIIDKALDKISLKLFTTNNSEHIDSGVWEFKVDVGPGYRIYFGRKGSDDVLLHGGDKSTQKRDIRKAKTYWADYEERENANQ